jgi:hypothetical protein
MDKMTPDNSAQLKLISQKIAAFERTMCPIRLFLSHFAGKFAAKSACRHALGIPFYLQVITRLSAGALAKPLIANATRKRFTMGRARGDR